MTKRYLGVLAAAAAMTIAPAGAAMGSHGADDPVPHARHGADDGQVHKARHHHRRHRRADDVRPDLKRGADDRAGDQRHGGGADDPAGHR